MSYLRGRTRIPVLLAVGALGLAVLGSATAIASVMRRDLPKQLELTDVRNGGIVIYGTITKSTTAVIDTAATDGTAGASEDPIPFTVLTVHVDQAVAPPTGKSEVTVYVPGVEGRRLSISPPETETRVGESLLMFLRPDQHVRAVDAQAFKLDSHAEVFRTQKNRKGDIVVLGEGPGCAVENNARLDDISKDVRVQFDAILKAGK